VPGKKVPKAKGWYMTEKFETRGEIGHALAGLRDQLALQAKVFAVAAGLSVVALGFLYNQYSAVSLKFADVLAANARLETTMGVMAEAMAKMETEMKQVRAEAAAVKGEVEAAMAPRRPEERSFPGWIGVQPKSPNDAKAIVDRYKSPAWIFTTAPQE
jgi:hypothetical protein